MKNNFFKTYCVLFLFLAVFSCQDDDNASLPEANQSGPKITIYEGKDANTRKGALLAKLSKSGKLSESKLRFVTASDQMCAVEQEVEINYDRVMETLDSYGNKHLTYEATSDIAPETVFFNLVVTEKDGKTKIVLVAYEMDESFATDYAIDKKMENFSGKITFTEVSLDPGFPCDETPTKPITVDPNNPGTGGGGGGGGNENPGGIPGSGSNPGGGYNQSIIDAQYLALQMMASMTDIWDDVHANPRYYRVAPVIANPNPCGGGVEVGILEPNINDLKNCEDLKKKSQNNGFVQKMQELKSKATSQNFESAYTLYQNAADGLSFSPEATGSAEKPEVALTLNTSATQSPINAIGFLHCHLDDGSTFKVFSFTDIIALAYIADISTRPTSELGIFVTTASGTFALKVNNKIALKGNLLRMQLAQNTYEEDFAKEIKAEETINEQILGMLRFMKKNFKDTTLGADLYQQSSDGSWDKLELSTNGKTVKSKKC